MIVAPKTELKIFDLSPADSTVKLSNLLRL